MGFEPASVHASVNTFKHKYLLNWQANHYQFHLEHHWGGELAVLDRIRALVSMARDSSHRVIIGKIL